MAKTESVQSKLDHTQNTFAYIAPFIEQLGNPANYEYLGECNDLGRVAGYCLCGHPIRYEFLIHHKQDSNKTAILGSECIGHFQHINPSLYADLVAAVEKLKSELAEAKRKAKEIQQDKEIAELKGAYDVAYEKVWNEYKKYPRGRVPDWLYWGFQDIPKESPRFVRKGAYINWYKRTQKKLDKLISAF